ncbi:MAG TPA: DUF3429 domain-containing protein [Sphingomonas sp.]|nr:DUF3429 domain-containing protein [Sphingomonas sp.]
MAPGSGNHGDPRPPSASVVLGIGAMLPLPLAALLAWTLPEPWPLAAIWLGIGWGAIILIFIGGVRRGLSFETPGGARLQDLAAMLWLFALGAATLVVPTPFDALILLIIGYASMGLLDRIASLDGHAPAHFARLRPVQSVIALAGLIALLVFWVLGG